MNIFYKSKLLKLSGIENSLKHCYYSAQMYDLLDLISKLIRYATLPYKPPGIH